MAKKQVKQPPRMAPPKAPEVTGARLELPPWPPGLPVDADKFWSAGGALSSLAELPRLDDTPALKRLGPLPFPRGGFPLMGFLATVYENVVRHLTRAERQSVEQVHLEGEQHEEREAGHDL